MKVFSTLAALSLLFVVYWRWSFVALSYSVWADERGVDLPERSVILCAEIVFLRSLIAHNGLSIFGDKGAFRGGEHPGRLQLARWLNDTPIYQDALEIVAEKARRAWWGEQLDLSMVAWGMLVAIEGRRRKIPYLWAFMALANLIGLSFAQNLFYVAMLLTPVPLPDNVKDLTKSSISLTSTRYV